MTILPLWKDLWPQFMPSLPLRCGCFLWKAIVWWLWNAQSIIPTSTGAARAADRFIPELNEKLIGTSFHVPTSNVSSVDLKCHLEKAAKYNGTKKMVNQASEGPLKDILSYTEDQVISCDFHSETHSSTFGDGADFGPGPPIPVRTWEEERNPWLLRSPCPCSAPNPEHLPSQFLS